MTPKEAHAQLRKIFRRAQETSKAVDRKKSLRPSEKAMWLADIEMDLDALALAMSVLLDRAITNSVPDTAGEKK